MQCCGQGKVFLFTKRFGIGSAKAGIDMLSLLATLGVVEEMLIRPRGELSSLNAVELDIVCSPQSSCQGDIDHDFGYT